AVVYLRHCTIDIDLSMSQINKNGDHAPSAQKKTPPRRWRKKLPEVLQNHLNHLRIPALQADELPISSLNGAAPARIPHGAILVDL
ncbi:hypothetical protein, partial [Salmonella enterica]|uniref:hypothetical protein n=1 Tax=Salmonella enterica TaxID=28901 RepID=UPI003CF40227